jgi:hypothetical protein
MLGSARTARYHIAARTDNELYWSSYLYCGIFELVAEGAVTVSFKLPPSLSTSEVLCTVVEVTDRETRERRVVAMDWRDNADILCLRKLTECDVYYKRNLIPTVTYPACPAELRAKIRPAGLSFAVRTHRERPLWVQVVGGLHRGEGLPRGRSVRDSARNWYKAGVRAPLQVASFLRLRQFECDTLDGARNAVLFQTKAYDPRGSSFPEDTRAVTEERAEIIATLRAELGEAFVGGFVPSRYAREAYPDQLAATNPTQRSYARLVKSCRISVYTRGLRDSPAFKLGEYLASARCIVAQEPKTQLPRPLEHGRELLYFDGPDDLVRKCRDLMADEALQRRLSEGARQYYLAEVQPRRRVATLLREAFAEGGSPRGDDDLDDWSRLSTLGRRLSALGLVPGAWP